MAKIPEAMRADKFKSMELTDGETTERVLGLFWRPKEDIFTFSLTFLKTKEDLMKGERVPAKRELLALVASIYDPLGLISLFTVRGKMMLQDAWRTKIGWNDEIPSSVYGKWTNWREGLLKIPEFAVKRCYSAAFSTANVVTLHIFADASEQAYGAVAYVVVKGPQEIEVALVSSRARVAPLKPLSIPRLELMAAGLAARLSKFIRDEHTVSFQRTVYWSDSRTVLCWLNGDGRKFQQFVAHRVGEVQELTNPQEWRWIPTKLNVADEMTRDVDPCDWSQDSRWINGPSFLREEEDKWPMEKPQEITEEGTEELKPEFSGAITSAPIAPALRAEEFSSWSRLIRITARLVKLAKKLNPEVQLTVQDLHDAEELWWRKVQEECYVEEKYCVINNKPLPTNSKVRHLNLWLDESGVLRLDGRLKNAKIDKGVKCPVLLDPKHPYTKLLLQNYHDKGGQHGQERMVNEVRQKFHIPQLRAAVKSSWNSCQHCKKMRAQPHPPLMGQLPSYRLEVGVHPFTNAGVDYFGPLEVTVGRSHEKRWGVLITCLSTRAVHLEIAASLSTDSCIMAIRRFVGRSGCPEHFYSDNGTNFHGANNEVKRALMELDEEKMKSTCAEKGIEWHFNPPSAPHMGGCWERLVKSVKVALLATVREQAPKEEVLQTLFVEAEHSVNSHPLTRVSIDPEDPEALTPNHFLIGRSSNVAPPGLFHHGDSCSKRVWRKAQRLADSFWQWWEKESLPTLQRRKKWLARTKPVEVGDVAVEVNPQQPRGKWTMGRVTAVFPGADGIVRVVDWKTASGTYRRPVAKLAILDVRQSEEAPEMSNDAAASLGVGGCRRLSETKKEEFPLAPHIWMSPYLMPLSAIEHYVRGSVVRGR